MDVANPDEFVFQALDWDFYHKDDYSDDDGACRKQFVIQIFGKTPNQDPVYIEVMDFKPFFFVEMNSKFSPKTVEKIIEEIKKNMSMRTIDEDSGEPVYVNISERLCETELVDRMKFFGFTAYSKFRFLKLSFDDYEAMRCAERGCKKPIRMAGFKDPIYLKVYESNILPLLRFIHIQDLEAVGWLRIARKRLTVIRDVKTCCKYNYMVSWDHVKKKDERTINKFSILAFDIECTSEDGSFPQPSRINDKVIQIGFTMSRVGEDECYEKHLLSLGETADITGVTVHSCVDEQTLLLKFPKLLQQLNPDIITGYNIFGFDYTYLKGRVDRLAKDMSPEEGKKFINDFSKLSRITNEISEWTEKNLSSAALGDNMLRYYKMSGRVNIDLMKVIQRDYKLSSYKLDSVASFFIRENISKLENMPANVFKISTKKTFGLTLDNFITIGYNDGAVEDIYNGGEKFKIQELGPNYVVASGRVDTTEFIEFMSKKGCCVFWSQAKDDMSPNDIFRLIKGTPQDRALIGKYCIQDCNLCNKLIAKLQILPNNIGMANVCHVPLSYLFLRGQGVKIFSLVAKKCRELNHLIPVIRKPFKPAPDPSKPAPTLDADRMGKTVGKGKRPALIDDLDEKMMEKHIFDLNNKNINDEEVEDEGYEGAIVFVPVPGVYFEPIPVLDYASLYPNSMRLRNLSHECFVNNPKYDNLPDYRYHTIRYKKYKGEKEDNVYEWVECRFAEKKVGERGIIPLILTELLDARKKYKKDMANAKDPFTYSVLDGLQQAYKVTANSLYGQTGASTSSICMKEIAASTTATGREMLQYSKHFIENVFSTLINKIITDKASYISMMVDTFKYHPTSVNIIDNDGENVAIHVNTDENDIIASSKFIRKSIGYEIDYAIPEECTKILDWGNILKNLSTLPPNVRESFAKTLYECIISDSGRCNIKKLWNTYNKVWQNSTCNTIDTLDATLASMIELPRDIRDKFYENLYIAIDEMGYVGREELYDKFYITMRKLLAGHTIDAKIIYGDSVTGNMPVLLRCGDHNGNGVGGLRIMTMDAIWAHYSASIYGCVSDGHDNKEYIDCIRAQVWTEKGWTGIRKMMRHRVNKKIYGVATNTGYVEVTEDHSLIDDTCAKITPNACITNKTRLLHSFPEFDTNTNTNTNESYDIGYQYGLEMVAMSSNGACNNDTANEIITCVINSSLSCMQGFVAAIIDNKQNADVIFASTSELCAACVYYTYKICNKDAPISITKTRNTFAIMRQSNTNATTDANVIQHITEIQSEHTYVYDFETENHHFHCGIGEMIVHNTDSVFFCPHIMNIATKEYLKDDLSLSIGIRLGIWASILITTLLPSPMAQEYEKVLWPFIIQGKKRYVGNLYEKDPHKFKQKSMGIELKRRDNAPIVKTVSAGIIHKILNERDAEGAFEFMKDILKKIITGKFKMEKFVITKTLKGNALTKPERIKEKEKPKESRSYVDRTRIVHAVLADRMADRDPGNKPLSNDRIPYAYIELNYEPDLQGDRVETPEYIINNRLKLDYLFYITNQIMKPALKFLDLITTNAGLLFRDYISREENRRRGIMPITYYAQGNGDEDVSDNDIFDADDIGVPVRNKKVVRRATNATNAKKFAKPGAKRDKAKGGGIKQVYDDDTLSFNV